MENKTLGIIVGSLVGVSVVFGYFLYGVAMKQPTVVTNTREVGMQNQALGSSLTYSAAQSQLELYNLLNGVINDLGHTSSVSWNPNVTLGSGAVASTTINNISAGTGD